MRANNYLFQTKPPSLQNPPCLSVDSDLPKLKRLSEDKEFSFFNFSMVRKEMKSSILLCT